MPDIKPGIEAAARLQAQFVAGVETTKVPLQKLQHDCRVLLSLIQQCLDDISANDATQVNWLSNWPFDVFDLSGYSPADIEDFKKTQKLALQEELDNSYSDGFRIVLFDLIEKNPGTGDGLFLPKAFLSPKISGPGGGGGTVNPGYPPK